MQEADLGINVDLDITETVLGSRNRFLSWIQAGLPILTTVISDVSRILHRNKLCFGIPTGDPERLKEAILYAADHETERKEMAVRAREFGHSHFTFEVTTEPVRRWVENPAVSPDNKARQKKAPLHSLDAKINGWLEQKPISPETAQQNAGLFHRVVRKLQSP